MPSIGTNSKPAYVYDAGTDTWIPIGPGEHTHDYIGKDVITTTGDLIYASAANTPARLGIGSSGQVLSVSGGVPAWSTLSAGGMTQLATTSFSGSPISFQNISQDYKSLLIYVDNAASGIRLNNETGQNYISLAMSTRTSVQGSAQIFAYLQPDLTYILGTYFFPQNNIGSQQIIEIHNYTSTVSRKLVRIHYVGRHGDTAWVVEEILGARTNSNDAITRVDLISNPSNGSATLYGVK